MSQSRWPTQDVLSAVSQKFNSVIATSTVIKTSTVDVTCDKSSSVTVTELNLNKST